MQTAIIVGFFEQYFYKCFGIVMLIKKFREDIPYSYDDLSIKDQMTRLAKCMKNDGIEDEILDYWIKVEGKL